MKNVSRNIAMPSRKRNLKEFTKRIWSEKIDLSQLFCGIEILPKSNIKERFSANIHINEVWHLICGENDRLYFKVGYNECIVLNFCDVEMLYRHTKCVFNWKLAFPMYLFWIKNFPFQFILILGTISIPQKSCDRSIFSLHMWL